MKVRVSISVAEMMKLFEWEDIAERFGFDVWAIKEAMDPDGVLLGVHLLVNDDGRIIGFESVN